jgi:hypothetical protein
LITDLIEDVSHSLRSVDYLFLLDSLVPPNNSLLYDDAVIPEADARGNSTAASLITDILFLVLLLLKGALIDRTQ